jgi:hypothetical protein
MTMRMVFVGALLTAVWCVQASAQASVRHRIDIEPQALGQALKALAQQTNIQFVYPSELVAGRNARALRGSMTPEEALDRLLAATRLKYEFLDPKTVTLTGAAAGNDSAPAAGSAVQHRRMVLSQAVAADAGQDRAAADEQPQFPAAGVRGSESDSTPAAQSGEVVVTGSRIARPASQIAANIIVLDAEALRATGESTLEKALRQLPQNMLGATDIGATVAISGNSFNGALNISGASNINLRGLGAESTLILVDGRRIGKSGMYGGASDVSGIPLSSVERVEIMLDGASSVYGSDAVGGVVNIILKKDYRGTQAAYEYGMPDAGGFEEHTATLSMGRAWGSGQVRGSFEFFKSTNLDGAERPDRIYSNRWAAPAGIFGTGLFYTYNGQNYTEAQLPGLGLTPASPGVAAVGFTQIPQGYTGTGPLPVSDLVPMLNNSDIREGMSLLPAIERRSVQVGFDQGFALGGRELTLSGNLDGGRKCLFAVPALSNRSTQSLRQAGLRFLGNSAAGNHQL